MVTNSLFSADISDFVTYLETLFNLDLDRIKRLEVDRLENCQISTIEG
jgi:hypothetical protein